MITFLAFVLVEVDGLLQNLHRCLIYYYGMLVLTENMSKECLFKVVMLAKNKVIRPGTRSVPMSQYRYLSNKSVFVDKASVQELKVGTG